MKKFIAIIVLTFTICIFATSVSAQTLTVTNSYANCRSKPGANNTYLGRVYKGETYEILGSDLASNGKRWYRITQKNGTGSYICGSFVKLNGTSNSKSNDTGSSSSRRLLGTYYVTGYCYHCNSPKNSYKTSSGRIATAGRTAAIKGLPFGTRIYIEGIGDRIVEDRPYRSDVCDVFMDSHGKENGITRNRKVYVYN